MVNVFNFNLRVNWSIHQFFVFMHVIGLLCCLSFRFISNMNDRGSIKYSPVIDDIVCVDMMIELFNLKMFNSI